MSVPDYSIRPLEREHLDDWLAVRNQTFPWPVGRERFLFDESLRPPDEAVCQLGAWTKEGALVGTAECYLGEEGERYVDRGEGFVTVAPVHRGRGLGTRLAGSVEQFALAQRVRWLEAILYERDLADAGRLLDRRGFHELERFTESWQEPATVNLQRLEERRSALEATGIQTSSFSAIDSPSMRQALCRCAMAIQRDMPHEPHADWTDAPFESWTRKVLESPGASPDTMFVARDGNTIVGLTYWIARGGGEAEVGDTGVIRSHRRRGIARVLKMLATQSAAIHGIRRLQTDNRADNVGMLAINRELGFVPGNAILIYEKEFA